MKYLVLLCDGMADTPVPSLGGKTPMEAADKPNMDALAARAILGMAKTVPDGMKPGSDVANLSALGYQPAECYTGRSPLEAASIGVDLSPSQYAIRCNLVTLSEEADFTKRRMADYCGGDISTAEAKELISCLDAHLPDGMRLYPGVSYRHCLVWDNDAPDLGDLTPPARHLRQGHRGLPAGFPCGSPAPLLDGAKLRHSAGPPCQPPPHRRREAPGQRGLVLGTGPESGASELFGAVWGAGGGHLGG